MRTMKNFAAQQLSMQQMMQILGGKYQVSVYAADGRFLNRITAVSYTHLDVYKRQSK